MNSISAFMFHSEVGHFILYMAGCAFVGGMPAPTANSGVPYRWMFSSLNSFAMNFSRAFGTKTESSPNFQAAMNIQTALAGQPTIAVQPVPEATDPEKKP
jgi:hypothetical protein